MRAHFSTGKFFRAFLRKMQFQYEVSIAPFLAVKACWIFLPFYLILKRFRICFVVNIASGTGHIICELDNFLRKLHLEEVDPRRRYVWIKKGDPFAKTCVSLYRRHFWWAISNTLIYDLLLPLLVLPSEISLDCGLSRLKWQLSTDKKRFVLPGQTFLYQISKKEGSKLWLDYYQRLQRSADYFPLLHKEEKEAVCLRRALGLKEKVALIHLKDVVKNATAKATDPSTYLPSIEYLLNKGYQVVFVGREKMPELFQNYPIVNYAESSIASFRNDIVLFQLADLAITSGSGIAFLADAFDRPYLYVNSWQLSMAMFSKKSIAVPALLQKKNGEILSFEEQMFIYDSQIDAGDEFFSDKELQARNATADEILNGLKELLSLDAEWQERSRLQEDFQTLNSQAPLYYVFSRVSDFFLERHASLLTRRHSE